MPNSAPHKLSININILKPQGNPEKVYVRLSRWALSTGRYIVIFIEIIVLAAFLSRFKFDADLADTKEKIDQQIPFVESLRPDEQLVRQTQLQLATVKDIRLNSINYAQVLQSLSSYTPQGVRIVTLGLEKTGNQVTLRISGRAQTNNDLASFVAGLRNDSNFSEITLTNAGLDQTVITFSLTGIVNPTNSQDQNI